MELCATHSQRRLSLVIHHITCHLSHITHHTSRRAGQLVQRRQQRPLVHPVSAQRPCCEVCSAASALWTCHSSHVTRHTSHVPRPTSHVTRHTSHVTRHAAACDGCPCTHLHSWCWILVRDSHCECNMMHLFQSVSSSSHPPPPPPPPFLLLILLLPPCSSSFSSFHRYHFNQPNPAPPSIDFVKDVHTFALASRFKAKKYDP